MNLGKLSQSEVLDLVEKIAVKSGIETESEFMRLAKWINEAVTNCSIIGLALDDKVELSCPEESGILVRLKNHPSESKIWDEISEIIKEKDND